MKSNLTGHLSSDDPQLSPATRALLAGRTAILDEWMAAARERIPQAHGLALPILENTLPAYFDTLAALLTPHRAAQAHDDLGALAGEHGGERARLTLYDATALIHELQLFRDVLFARIEAAGIVLDGADRAMLGSHIDAAIRESANAFSVVQAALREQYLAAVAHDLRTPLSAAQMAAQLIARSSTDDTARGFAGRILASTRRIDTMTREMLDRIAFDRCGPIVLELVEFDMMELVGEVAQQAAVLHAIALEPETEPVVGWWCRTAIQRAVENLVGNAVKYGNDETIRLSVSTTVERVQVLVHNRGEPIAPEDRESIFQLYRRAGNGGGASSGNGGGKDGGSDGWGVGLSYVRRVAEAHGGSILMSSTAGDGTTFVIDMPLDARPFAGAPTAA